MIDNTDVCKVIKEVFAAHSIEYGRKYTNKHKLKPTSIKFWNLHIVDDQTYTSFDWISINMLADEINEKLQKHIVKPLVVISNYTSYSIVFNSRVCYNGMEF